MVAEGLKNEDGGDIIDEAAGLDSFGHPKLAGAGKYVCQQLTKRFKADKEIAQFMKDTKMYVEGLYEAPEVREVRPGHLVRCGRASAYDVTFGKEVGAAAVQLLANDIYGVTVAHVNEGKIKYMKTKEAIKQRHVDLELASFHEDLGISFGRKKIKAKMQFIEIKEAPDRHL